MPGVISRFNVLKRKILGVRLGPGAAILPSEVTRLHLEFAHLNKDGHMGPRKFWKENLPRLKYWNPAVPMVVNRTHNNAGPARLTVYMRDGSGEPVDVNNFPTTSWSNPVSKAPAPAKGEKAVVINMKNRHSSQILSEFLQTTGAVQVKPTPQEEQEQDEIRELLRKAAADSARTAAENAIKRREKAMLAKARDEAAAIKAAS